MLTCCFYLPKGLLCFDILFHLCIFLRCILDDSHLKYHFRLQHMLLSLFYYLHQSQFKKLHPGAFTNLDVLYSSKFEFLIRAEMLDTCLKFLCVSSLHRDR